MPVYAYECIECRTFGDLIVAINERDNQHCEGCGGQLVRHLAAPMVRVAGQIPEGGGPDRFTADALGIPLAELPSGLKVKP